ncbi:PadR family transcriptional regulator [Paenibacillus sp. TRM 82003]|uniref:PadR family transcriptional regulator n=1 Tax=Kineococcus sp. TRM81007 TaxID=2925831 RepID=UPI001F59668C|nr:PadR family transcriptional regulator [Kineococcus sp. TRM81007]MCI2238454.1 PadR family transcriptional regulator [Kineococcus sp. TRM81007]MCI3922032.1 PadR family transcriptional regulator [Paenibacillus sp. TRM 82003]
MRNPFSSFPGPEGPGPRGGGHRHHRGECGRPPFEGPGGPGARGAFGGRGGFGPAGFGPAGFGPGGPGRGGFGPRGPEEADWPFPFGPGSRGRGGPRRPKGDVRAAVLVLLAEGPSNGYRIIGEVERRSDGAWKPSPGSVYPTLQQLQDEGLVTADPADPKRFTLTDAGRDVVERELAGAPAPWESVGGRPSRGEFRDLGRQVQQIAGLLHQVALSGRPGDAKRAGDVLERCRQDLLRLLAEDPREESRGDQDDAG